MPDQIKLLIVDDERVALKNLEYVMKNEGYDVVATQSGANAIRHLEEQQFDVVLSDVRMAKVDGMQVLRRCRELSPETEIILITAHASLESAVDTMKLGAFSYVAKPAKLSELRKVVREAAEKVRLKKERRSLKERAGGGEGTVRFITQDPAMQKLLHTTRQIALSDSNAFITGPAGAGKKLLARYLHEHSRRSAGPFFALNCAALPEEALAHELFGHEKDAAGDTPGKRKGLIEAACGGSLLLSEVTALSPSLQLKLLQAIEEKEVVRIGGLKPVKVDVRFLTTANPEADAALSPQREPFRQDLYYRLNVVSLAVPPLSERRDDIPLLSYYFLQKHSAAMQKAVSEMSVEAVSLFMTYAFPGNVRELEQIVERGVALATGPTIERAHLPESLKDLDVRTFRKKEGKIPSLEEQEKAYILWVLSEVAGNRTMAAQVLGIDRVSLWRKLKRYGLDGE